MKGNADTGKPARDDIHAVLEALILLLESLFRLLGICKVGHGGHPETLAAAPDQQPVGAGDQPAAAILADQDPFDGGAGFHSLQEVEMVLLGCLALFGSTNNSKC